MVPSKRTSLILWLYLSIFFAISHQIYVLICWRYELFYKGLSKFFAKNAFKVYKIGFTILILLRPVLIIILSISNSMTINIGNNLSYLICLLLFIPGVYGQYSVFKYFGINTYTTGIFKAWFSLGDIGTAIQLACLLLLVVFFFFVLEKISSSKTKFFYETNSPIQRLLYVNKDKLLFIHLVCSIPFILGFFIPKSFIRVLFI